MGKEREKKRKVRESIIQAQTLKHKYTRCMILHSKINKCEVKKISENKTGALELLE